jgi:uncharacterized protein (TIGR02391 family)
MTDALSSFERIVRAAKNAGERAEVEDRLPTHPFDERNVHPDITSVCQRLFDDGHYSQATFEAFKYIDNEVKNISGENESGFKLMMDVFNEKNPKIKLTDMATPSEIDEQMGYRFTFAGVMSAIRNPRGHDITTDPIDRCLDHLSVASVLLRRLEERKAP